MKNLNTLELRYDPERRTVLMAALGDHEEARYVREVRAFLLARATVLRLTPTEIDGRCAGLKAFGLRLGMTEADSAAVMMKAKEVRELWWVGGAVMRENGTITTHGYKQDGSAFAWVKKLIDHEDGIGAAVVSGSQKYMRMGKDLGWIEL